LDFFLQTYRPAYAKMTVSGLSLPMMSDGLIYLMERGFTVACNLAYGISWTKENLQILERELDRLVAYYGIHPEKEVCALLEFPYREIYKASVTKEVYACCSAGRETVAYDVNGESYPCHMFFSTNHEQTFDASRLSFPVTGIVDKNLLDEKCRECPIASVCQQCYGSNYLSSGSLYHVAQEVCDINRITFRMKAKMAANIWGQKQLALSEEDEYQLLSSIMLVDQME
nr:SPASM domain-containing protein [Lachnospiraceae bacterium]